MATHSVRRNGFWDVGNFSALCHFWNLFSHISCVFFFSIDNWFVRRIYFYLYIYTVFGFKNQLMYTDRGESSADVSFSISLAVSDIWAFHPKCSAKMFSVNLKSDSSSSHPIYYFHEASFAPLRILPSLNKKMSFCFFKFLMRPKNLRRSWRRCWRKV